MNTSNLKDIISTIIAILLVVAEPINSWLISGQPFDWRVFISACLVATVAYLQGKNPDGTAKTTTQVVKANAEAAATKE